MGRNDQLLSGAPMKRVLKLMTFPLIAAVAAVVRGTWVAEAQPSQTVAHWSYSGQCVTGSRWTYDTESLTKQTLPNEWNPSWRAEALKAGATIIRQDSWYKHNHPESGWGLAFCLGVSPYQFDWRDSYMAFVNGSNQASTNDATDATRGIGWHDNSTSSTNLDLPFGDCLQYDTQAQAVAGYGYGSIVGSGTYPPGQYAPGNACGSPVKAPLYATCLYYSCGGGGK